MLDKFGETFEKGGTLCQRCTVPSKASVSSQYQVSLAFFNLLHNRTDPKLGALYLLLVEL